MNRSALAAGVRCLRSLIALQGRREESDEQLLHAFTTQHDDGAFAVLVRRYGPLVMGVCRRVLRHTQDAEDAFQATFLVLARHAATLRNKTALVSWLHGVAYRMAMTAKRSAARRRKHESRAPGQPSSDPADELSWREVRMLLDEEIARLPEIYRSVFVLCCLENVSREEAARRLGLKLGTVSSRLAAARKRLAHRLARRGVELTAVLAAAALATPSASALPAVLIAKTTQTVLAAAGGELASLVSPAVAALVQSATAAMMVSRAKMAALVLLVVSLLAGASVWACRGLIAPAIPSSAEPPAAKAEDKPKAASPKPETVKTVEIQGRVLGPDGKPKPGAKILLLGKDEKITQLGVSAVDGRFTINVPKVPRDQYLIAQAEATGIDFLGLEALKAGTPIEFRLVHDQAIRGRVVNTEGKPIRGVRVAVDHLGVYPNNSLDSFLAVWKKGQNVNSGVPNGLKHIWRGADTLLAAMTDAEGRFLISQVGEERLVALCFSGAGIADAEAWVVNRPGFDPRPYNEAVLNNSNPRAIKFFGNRWRLYGPGLVLVAEAGKPIRGIVKDADSGKGRPGVRVRFSRRDNGMLVHTKSETRTDAQGRYEILAHKAKRYMLEVADDPSAGYMASQVWTDDTFGYDPITVDIPVKKGVIVTGKVIDQSTGKPVPGWAMADILSGNPFAKEYPHFTSAASVLVGERTAEDGTFRVVAIPGPVLLMGGRGPDSEYRPEGNLEILQYKNPLADAKYPQYFHTFSGSTMYHSYSGSKFLQGNFCKVLEIKSGVTVVKQDIVLERARALAVTIQDAEGRPCTGVWATGIRSENWRRPVLIKNDSCSAYEVEAGKPRLMVFYEPSKKLVGTLTLKGDEKPPVVAKLGPAGAIKGRLLDDDGKLLAGVVVDVHYRDREAEKIHTVTHEAKQIMTDATGAFTLDGVIPEMKFELLFRRGKHRFERETKPAEATIQVQPGTWRDVGAIKLKRIGE